MQPMHLSWSTSKNKAQIQYPLLRALLQQYEALSDGNLKDLTVIDFILITWP